MSAIKFETDRAMRSLFPYGSPDFPFEYYRDEMERYEGRQIPWHWHLPFECSYVASGGVIFRTFSHEEELSEGDALFINSGTVHAFEAKGSCLMQNMIFEPAFLAPRESRIYRESAAPCLEADLPYRVFRKEEGQTGPLIDAVRSCALLAEEEEKNGKALRLQGAVNRIWQEFLKLCPPEEMKKGPASGKMQLRVRQMLSFIYENYGERIGLEDIASSAHISRREALRSFSETLGMSPVAYLNDYRLGRAEQLLTRTELSVTQIALECGYDNSSYFGKAFHSRFGTSPRAFRAGKRAEG